MRDKKIGRQRISFFLVFQMIQRAEGGSKFFYTGTLFGIVLWLLKCNSVAVTRSDWTNSVLCLLNWEEHTIFSAKYGGKQGKGLLL